MQAPDAGAAGGAGDQSGRRSPDGQGGPSGQGGAGAAGGAPAVGAPAPGQGGEPVPADPRPGIPLRVRFPSPVEAEIACRTLAPREEPQQQAIHAEFTVDGSLLIVLRWRDGRLLRTSFQSFLNQLTLMLRNMRGKRGMKHNLVSRGRQGIVS
uniref:L antigen family member 3 n=1 Tax=Prolemur simus TaxID=1328070 RepID=A0A8C8YIU1_PROSS